MGLNNLTLKGSTDIVLIVFVGDFGAFLWLKLKFSYLLVQLPQHVVICARQQQFLIPYNNLQMFLDMHQLFSILRWFITLLFAYAMSVKMNYTE